MEKPEAIVAEPEAIDVERALLKLWEYAAEIQHKVPRDQAFDLLFERLDQQWRDAARAARRRA